MKIKFTPKFAIGQTVVRTGLHASVKAVPMMVEEIIVYAGAATYHLPKGSAKATFVCVVNGKRLNIDGSRLAIAGKNSGRKSGPELEITMPGVGGFVPVLSVRSSWTHLPERVWIREVGVTARITSGGIKCEQVTACACENDTCPSGYSVTIPGVPAVVQL